MGSLTLPSAGVIYLDTPPSLTASDVRLISITEVILRQAARLRAQTNLKTPDAIHAATALTSGCMQFIMNDPAFRRVTGLNVVVLSELI